MPKCIYVYPVPEYPKKYPKANAGFFKSENLTECSYVENRNEASFNLGFTYPKWNIIPIT